MDFVIRMLKKRLVCTIFALICGFLSLNAVLRIANISVGDAYVALFQGTFGKAQNISFVIVEAAPLILTGLGVAFAYKTGLFNIGAEGQYMMGTFATVAVGISLQLHPVIVIPLALLAGTLAGAFWGGICGFLKAKFGINEVITSIMLNWIALYFGNLLLKNPYIKNPATTTSKSVNISYSIMILPEWKFTTEAREWGKAHPFLMNFLRRPDVNAGIIIAILACIAVYYLIYRTTKGYELRAVGLNKHAAELAGINVNRNILHSMLISGAICGLAGAIVILGIGQRAFSQLASFNGLGFNGLAVAFLAMASPIGCIFSGLLFGALLRGGIQIQAVTHAPREVIDIMIGVLVFSIALNSAIPLLIGKLEKRNATKVKKEVSS